MPLRAVAGSDSGWVGAGVDDDLDARLEAEMAEFDEGLPHVLTALGPIEPAALGVTLVGGWGRPVVAAGADPGAVLLEHEQLYAIGVRAVVDLASARSQREWSDLAWLSARSPLHIVAARPAGGDVSPDRVRAGAITLGVVSGRAARAHQAASLPAFSDEPHMMDLHMMADQGEVLASALRRDRAIVAGPVLARTSGEWAVVLGSAGYIALQISGANGPGELAAAAAMVRGLTEQGFGDRLLLGYENDPFAMMELFPLALMEADLPVSAVRGLLVDNPARALMVVPEGRR